MGQPKRHNVGDKNPFRFGETRFGLWQFVTVQDRPGLIVDITSTGVFNIGVMGWDFDKKEAWFHYFPEHQVTHDIEAYAERTGRELKPGDPLPPPTRDTLIAAVEDRLELYGRSDFNDVHEVEARRVLSSAEMLELLKNKDVAA